MMLDELSKSLEEDILPELTYTSSEMEIAGKTAYLTWTDDEGISITIQMHKIDEEWKLHKLYFGKP